MNCSLNFISAKESFLLVAAMVCAFFFNGSHLFFLAGTATFLILALAVSFRSSYHDERAVNASLISLFLSLFGIYLFTSILWSQVPYASAIGAWWLAVPAFAYGIYWFSPGKGKLYKTFLAASFFFGGLQVLLALYQYFWLGTDPLGFFFYRNLLAAFLTLIALVLLGVMLTTRDYHARSLRAVGLAFLFLLIFTVGITQSRGAILSISIALLLFFVGSWRLKSSGKRLLALAGTVISAFVAADLVMTATKTALTERMATLGSPFTASTGRLDMWQSCLNMLRDTPWWGTGVGTWWLTWIPYRPSTVPSLNFAHNDYLQLLIEGGIPLAIILLVLMFLVARSWTKTMFSKETAGDRKIEALSLFSALLALAVHTVFDFNFYAMPTMMVAGILIARLDHIAPVAKKPCVLKKALPVGRGIFHLCLVGFTVIALSFPVSMGVAHYHTEKGIEHFGENRIIAASQSFGAAARAWRAYDIPYYSQALILGSLLENTHGAITDRHERENILLAALEQLDIAERRNPFRPNTYHIRARILATVEGDDDSARHEFSKALQANPRYYLARVDYARYLIDRGAMREACIILEEGMTERYPHSPAMIPYYHMTCSMRVDRGDHDGADRIARRIEFLKEVSREREGSGRRLYFTPSFRPDIQDAAESCR